MLAHFWETLAATPAATIVRESVWTYLLLETVHIVGLGLQFGAIAMMDIRLLGLCVIAAGRLMAYLG